ncbi:MAG TPA: FecR family protein [Candidatus Dormibacteraeota bacterium]|nr:FecR family protein [Candidatus Dormibacteraeota bacterium]
MPKQRGCFGRGCGCGCGGCLVGVVLAGLLVLGSGYYFFVVQAQASVSAPAALTVINQPVDVDGNPGIAGQALNPGSTVHTGEGGHAAIQFPDGSFVRMSPDTSVTLTAARLQNNGNLQEASVVQKIGRTFTSVQHLVGGATFQVGGHSVSAQVRGTEFEVLVRGNGTNLIKVFEGTVTVTGTTTIKLTAGQQVDVDASGRLSSQRATQPDPQDPYPLTAQCSTAASSGNTAGTMQSSSGESLTKGNSAESDYNSPGGNLTLAFCYPGSLMSVTVTDPAGTTYTRRGTAPIVIKIANGPAGVYKALVTAIDVPVAGEAYSLTFATDASCSAGNIGTGTVVRWTMSNSEIANTLAQSGSTGITLRVQGTSPTSARIEYYSNVGGMPISWTIVFYSASPNLGAVVTKVAVRGINVTTRVTSSLSTVAGSSTSSIPAGFIVDRVYSCKDPKGDGLVVVEGHR